MLVDYVCVNCEKEGGLCLIMNFCGILKLLCVELFIYDWLFYFGVGGLFFKFCGIYFCDD